MANRINPWAVLLLLIFGFWAFNQLGPSTAPKISYTDFKTLVTEGKVKRVRINDTRLIGELKKPERLPTPTGPAVAKRFVVDLPPPQVADRNLLDFLEKHDVEVVTEPPSIWPQLLLYLGPTLDRKSVV